MIREFFREKNDGGIKEGRGNQKKIIKMKIEIK